MQHTFPPTQHFSLQQLAKLWLSMVRRRSDALPAYLDANPNHRESFGDTSLLTPIARSFQREIHHRSPITPTNPEGHGEESAEQDLETMIHTALAEQLNRLSVNIEKGAPFKKNFYPKRYPQLPALIFLRFCDRPPKSVVIFMTLS
ncbi:MAG: hypothetical protein R2932_43815 [Caldilineaceae bacterium]